MLVVAAIVAVVVAIALPALRQARMIAQQMACGSNIRQQGVAMHSYFADHRERIPYAWWTLGSTAAYAWDDLIDPYLGNRWSAAERQSVAVQAARANPVLTCPSDSRRESAQPPLGLPSAATRSFSMPRGPAGADGVSGVAATGSGPLPPSQHSLSANVPAPSGTFLVVERSADQPIGGFSPNNLQGAHQFAEIDGPDAQDPGIFIASSGPSVVLGRGLTTHGSVADPRMNYLFIDGHVRSMAITDTLGTAASIGSPPAGPWTRRAGD